jgi:hypothetical protein
MLRVEMEKKVLLTNKHYKQNEDEEEGEVDLNKAEDEDMVEEVGEVEEVLSFQTEQAKANKEKNKGRVRIFLLFVYYLSYKF